MTDLPRPRSNFDAWETALLEARWRGDELDAVLSTARAELASVRGELACAEEAVAELGLIGDAAQAAIDRLRTQLAHAETAAQHYLRQRDAVGAELFDAMRRCEAELGTGAAERYFASAAGNSARPLRRGWRRSLGAGIRAFSARITRRR